VSLDEQHVALPQLYGAPAYARPPKVVAEVERPFDPDELPLEAEQTDEEREYASMLPAHAYGTDGADGRRKGRRARGRSGRLLPRALSLRAIAGKLLGGD
jgi:hypothetical protein